MLFFLLESYSFHLNIIQIIVRKARLHHPRIRRNQIQREELLGGQVVKRNERRLHLSVVVELDFIVDGKAIESLQRQFT